MSHALRGFYELADILIVLDEVLLLEISNFARQLKFSLVIRDDHPIITHLTVSLWFRSMDLTITSSTSKSRGPSNERNNVAATEKQLESIYAIDYIRRLELFETACKVFAITMEVRHVWSRLRFFPWFRATLTSWLYMVTKDHMRKSQKEYRQFQAEIGPEAFKRPLLTNRNAITTGWKRVGRVSRNNTKARESILEEDLAKNVSLSLHNSFCLNRESRLKSLQEQKEWMRSYEQLKAWEEIVISSDDEEALLKQFAVSNTSGSSTSRAKNAR